MKICKKFLIVFLFIVGSVEVTQGGFMDYGWGARGAGKGGAFIASVDDASAALWNPAGFSKLYMRELMVSYHKPYAGLDGINLNKGFASFAYPISGGPNLGVAVTTFDGDSKYRETVIQLTAASRIIDSDDMTVSIGTNLKQLSNRYYWDDEIKDLDDPITNQDGTEAYTMDLGLLLEPSYSFSIGATLKNVIAADVGLVTEDIVPMELKAGAAYRWYGTGLISELVPEVVAGYRDQEYKKGRMSWGAGIECWFSNRNFALRLGANENEYSAGASFEKCLGSHVLCIDYAALLSTTFGDNYGSHRVSAALRF